MLVVGARRVFAPAWWLDPVRALLSIVLPVFCLAAYSNQFNYWTYNQSANFVTLGTFALGVYSLLLLVLGILVARVVKPRRDAVTLVMVERARGVLIVLGLVTIVAYVLLFGTLAVNYGLVIALLRGDVAAASALREALGRIPGVTSLVEFGVVVLGLLSALRVLGGYRPDPVVRYLAWAIFGLGFARSILNSERLALLEVGAAFFIVPIAYGWRPSVWKNLAPYLGIVAVFVAFAAGEYFRSWQYYQRFYTSYLEFILARFGGYFSTSINNGAGEYLMVAQYHPTPEKTTGWITKFPILENYFQKPGGPVQERYLALYATPEFNNPGGLYAAFLDYPFLVATLFMLFVGFAIGFTHRSFQNKELFGLMLYPMVFLGLTDLIRILYIAESRTLPMFLGVLVALYLIRPQAAQSRGALVPTGALA